MGEFKNIAQSLAHILRGMTPRRDADDLSPEDRWEDFPRGGPGGLMYPGGIGIDDLPAIFPRESSPRGHCNLYPSPFQTGCCELAVFISLTSPAYITKRRGHLTFRQVMEKLVQHSFNCKRTTKQYVVIIDSWDPSVVCEWGYVQDQIRSQGAILEIYLISVTERSETICEMQF